MRWRSAALASGVKESALPPIEDLSTIAGPLQMTRARMDSLPLKRPAAAIRFAPEIMSAMREAPIAAVEVGLAPTGSLESTTEEPSPRRKHQGSTATEVEAPVEANAADGAGAAPKLAPTGVPAPPSNGRPAQPGLRDAAVEAGTGIRPSENEDYFAPYDDSAGPALSQFEPSITVLSDASVRVAWAEAKDGPGVSLYRVVTSEDWPPYSPESGTVLPWTSGTELQDVRPITGALRFIQVWVNRGADVPAARRSQPSLLASGVAIAPPRAVLLREDHGTVVGTWQVAPTVSVNILRLPVGHAGELSGYDERYLLNVKGEDARSGYRDSTCQTGQDYEYRLFAVIRLDGIYHLSDPVVRQVSVGADLSPVDDLVITSRSGEKRVLVDVEWSHSGQGQVWLYRTAKAPSLGSGSQDIHVSALTLAGLADGDKLTFPASVEGERRSVRAVPWPPDWGRFHLTAVTVDRDMARIGATSTLTRTGSIEDALLVQRVNWQLLTFGWPENATQVEVFTTVTGAAAPVPGKAEPAGRLDRATYEAQGGLRLKDQLKKFWQGCDVHLMPVSFYGGASEHGRPTILHYPGLLKVRYEVIKTAGGRRWRGLRRIHEEPSMALRIQCDQMEPPKGLLLDFLLVHNATRLPLWLDDGELIEQWRRQPVMPRSDFHLLRLTRRPPLHGFVRLFVTPGQADEMTVALLDPDFRSLRL